ncbi:MAG: TSUP family transporter, partial [Paracoccaceae bacterium]
LKLMIAGFLILYGLFFLLRRRLPKFERPTPVADMGVGFASGVLGGLAGLSGALPAMWCALRPWPRHETRAVLQPFNFVILLISCVILATRGAYTWDALPQIAAAIIAAGIAAQIGIAVFKRLDDTTFRWLLIGLMLASGLVLLLRTLG